MAELSDLFHLNRYRDEIVELEGFGEKSYQKLYAAIERSRNCSMPSFLYGLGIGNIGLRNAKLICQHFPYDVTKLRHVEMEDLMQIDGIGELIAKAFIEYFSDAKKQEQLDALLQEVTFEKEEMLAPEEQLLADKTFVVTGSLTQYANRNALKAEIERLGGKVAGSVSKKTDYLINNDATSNSSKNKKAKELNIPILTEEAFRNMIKQEGSETNAN